MTDRDRASAPNKYEAQEATYVALDRLRRLKIGRRVFDRRIRRRSSETRRRTRRGVGEGSSSATGCVDEPARRVGAGSRNELGAGASRQSSDSPGWLEISIESALNESRQCRGETRAEGAGSSQVAAGGNGRGRRAGLAGRNVWEPLHGSCESKCL
jgi:hypothetical protein